MRPIFPRPRLGPVPHVFNGEHHWEINKKDYPLKKIIDDFNGFSKLQKTYRVEDYPYHRFFVFKK